MTHNKDVSVLVVDDDDDIREVISESFSNQSFKVFEAPNGQKALELMEAHNIDVVITDLRMPVLSGSELIDKIRHGQHPNTTIICLSGKRDAEVKECYEKGVDVFFEKPVSPQSLISAAIYHYQRTHQLNQLEEEADLYKTKMMAMDKMAVLGEMASCIAHEIKGPLQALMTYSTWIIDLFNSPIDDTALFVEKGKRHMEKNMIAMEKIDRIVKSLSLFSRDGSQDPFYSTSIREIVTEAEEICRSWALKNRVTLIVDDIPQNIMLKCRPSEICQVLINLVRNATDAVTELADRWVHISVGELFNNIEISVTDSGGGIPPDICKKIFEPFFTTKQVGQGTGLGLAISKKIVEAHKGAIFVDTSCKNTRFVVIIPKNREE